MRTKTSDTLATVAALAAFGERILECVKESGLAKPKRRAKRVVKKAKAGASKQAKPVERVVRPRPTIAS